MSANAVLVLDSDTDKVYKVDFEWGDESLKKASCKKLGQLSMSFWKNILIIKLVEYNMVLPIADVIYYLTNNILRFITQITRLFQTNQGYLFLEG